MLRKLMGRGRSPADARTDEGEIDIPIVHETVPEEVFDTPSQNIFAADMSWMDAVPIVEPPIQKAPEAAAAVPEQPKTVREERYAARTSIGIRDGNWCRLRSKTVWEGELDK